MALWGNTDADEAKPKWLTTDEKDTTFATERGWVKLDGIGNEEVLCAIGELSTSVAGADITRVAFVSSSLSKAAGGNIDVRVTYNEKVDVVGTPVLVVTNDQTGGGSATLNTVYNSGTGTNRLVFRLVLSGGAAGIGDGNTLSVAAQKITKASGEHIRDAGTVINSSVAVPSNSASMSIVT